MPWLPTNSSDSEKPHELQRLVLLGVEQMKNDQAKKEPSAAAYQIEKDVLMGVGQKTR